MSGPPTMTDLAMATAFAVTLTVGAVRGWARLERRFFPPSPPWPELRHQLPRSAIIDVSARRTS